MKVLFFLSCLILIFTSYELFAQSSPTELPKLPSDTKESEKDLKASGSPTYIKYVDPKTGEEKQKKVHYGFQYKKASGDAEPIGEKQYSAPGTDGSDGVGKRWGWQYPGSAKVKMSTGVKEKTPQFQKVVRSPIQVEASSTESADGTTKKAEQAGKAPKMTEQDIQNQILELAKQKAK
jgi:hypothetical protein